VPKTTVVIAADSTLQKVRNLESRAYLAQTIDTVLRGSTNSYAAICLIETTDHGKPTSLWVYGLRNGDGGLIYVP
jgi:hypothetical protein